MPPLTPGLRSLVGACLLLTAALVVLSAYIRLNHAGLGCDGWPACYGEIGTAHIEPAAPIDSSGDAYNRLVGEGHTPQPWTAPAHRLIASLLGICIIVLNLAELRRRDRALPRLIPMLLLGLTIFLAVIGLYSNTLHQPAIIVGNLFGGFAMLALLWWLWLGRRPVDESTLSQRALRNWASLGLLLLTAQIGLGGVTSANFAALACTTFPDCQGAWLPDAHLATALDVFRDMAISEHGVVEAGPHQQAIHIAHRLGAWLTLATLLMVAVLAARAGMTAAAVTLAALILIETGIGITAVLTSLPVLLATAHNALAALALLAVLYVLHRAQQS